MPLISPLQDTIPGLSARVRIFKKFDSGEEETVFHGNNLIVTSGKLLVLRNLYSVGGGGVLAYAKVGTGGAIDPAGTLLRPVDPTMTDLFNPVATLPIYQAGENPSAPSVSILASVDNSQANGLTLNEAGFFSSEDVMFNIKVFPGTYKTSAFALNFQWDVFIL